MKRRDFLKNTAAASAPLMLNGLPVFAMPSTGNALLDMIGQSNQSCGRVLIIIQQNGGNDGLNTVIPLNKYSILQSARGNVLAPLNNSDPAKNILPLNGHTDNGLHPAMTEMRDLYNTGKLAIVQAVSYPNPNYSHFRATDIWFSGSASNENWETGWLGRELDTTYPYYPGGKYKPDGTIDPAFPAYPNAQALDPLAIQIGSSLPFSLQGPGVNMGYNVSTVESLTDILNGTTDAAPDNDYGRELTFMRQMKGQSNAYVARIKARYAAQPNTLSPLYPTAGTNRLADSLKMIARLIGGGLTTPIYIVNHPNSHDTHEGQVDSTGVTGWQYNNLSILSKAIGAFQDDIQRMGKADKVTGMTFSEFGRRVKSNDSIGTDHGTSAPVFFFGARVQGGVIGSPLTFTTDPNAVTVNTQVSLQHDYRRLYATVMQDWLCLTQAESNEVLGATSGNPFAKLPIFTNNSPLPLDGVSLTGQYYQGQSHLSCRAEQNARYQWYALEFSSDGQRFNEVGRQLTNSLSAQATYTYTHKVAAPKMFYRIAAQDHQGKVDYSNTVLLRTSDKLQLIRVFPNPVTNHNIHVEFFEKVNGPVEVTIYDLVGAKVYYNHFNGVQNTLNFRVPQSFSNETHYILEVSYGQTKTREQIIFR